jgi:hypothetical protein
MEPGVERAARVCQRFRTTGQEATTSTARRIHGSTIACVLLAFAMTTAATAEAAARPSHPRRPRHGADVRHVRDDVRAAAGLASPDARRRDRPRHLQRPRRDLATCPHRPAACGHGALQALAVTYPEAPREAATAVKPPQSVPVRSNHGIDWDDAGIGAASPLGVIALALEDAITILQRRRSRRRTATVPWQPEPNIDANAEPACAAPAGARSAPTPLLNLWKAAVALPLSPSMRVGAPESPSRGGCRAAGAARQGRPTPRGRHGRLGLGAA